MPEKSTSPTENVSIFTSTYQPLDPRRTLMPNQSPRIIRATRGAGRSGNHLRHLLELYRAFFTGVLGALLLIYAFFRISLFLMSVDDHGYSIPTFIANIHQLDYEVHGEFSPFGIKYYETTQYQPGEVDHSQAATRLSAHISFGHYIDIHNHPFHDTPFSFTDLINRTGDFDSKHVIVVSRDHIYELIAPNGWPSQEDASTFLLPYLINYQAAAELGFVNVYPYDDDNVAVGTNDHLLSEYAQAFGLIYKSTPYAEWSLY